MAKAMKLTKPCTLCIIDKPYLFKIATNPLGNIDGRVAYKFTRNNKNITAKLDLTKLTKGPIKN
jgi:hypothetical protein